MHNSFILYSAHVAWRIQNNYKATTKLQARMGVSAAASFFIMRFLEKKTDGRRHLLQNDLEQQMLKL